MSKKKSQIYGMNVGSSSMLMIFVILCLISFATLSIVSANADKKLTSRIAERTSAYYEACNSAQRSLASIDGTLKAQYAASAGSDEYFRAVGHSKSYAIPVSESQTLFVEIEILYPKNPDDTFYTVKTWKIITESPKTDD